MSGTITSGLTGWRGGKPSVEKLPEARLTYAELFSIDERERPRVIPTTSDMAIVKYGLHEWPVLVATSPCHFGGHRRWLVCSRCQVKRVALYVSESQLACRECIGLRYGSQHESERDRAFRRANAIRDLLKWRPGIANSNGPKPLGMHWRTFHKLVNEYDAISSYLLGEVKIWVEKAESRSQNLQLAKMSRS